MKSYTSPVSEIIDWIILQFAVREREEGRRLKEEGKS